MKLRQLRSESPVMKRLASVPDKNHPLSLLKRATAVTEEEFINWIYDLRKNAPTLYDSIADELVYGLEVNIFFRKRSDSRHGHSYSSW